MDVVAPEPPVEGDGFGKRGHCGGGTAGPSPSPTRQDTTGIVWQAAEASGDATAGTLLVVAQEGVEVVVDARAVEALGQPRYSELCARYPGPAVFINRGGQTYWVDARVIQQRRPKR